MCMQHARLIFLVIAEGDKEIVVKAMSHYEKHTCLRFKERTDEEDFVEFEKGYGYATKLVMTVRQF